MSFEPDLTAARDLTTAVETVAGAELCAGLHRTVAEEFELALLVDFDSGLAGRPGRVRAYSLESSSDPALVRLSLLDFADGESIVKIESFRRGGAWVRFGSAAIELSAARALAFEILKISPNRSGGKGVPQ